MLTVPSIWQFESVIEGDDHFKTCALVDHDSPSRINMLGPFTCLVWLSSPESVLFRYSFEVSDLGPNDWWNDFISTYSRDLELS
jgi:hypothetical protein